MVGSWVRRRPNCPSLVNRNGFYAFKGPELIALQVGGLALLGLLVPTLRAHSIAALRADIPEGYEKEGRQRLARSRRKEERSGKWGGP